MIAYLRRREARYLLVGIFFAVFSNLLLIAFDNWGLHYGLAMFVCVCLCIPAAYMAQSSITFKASLNWTGFFRYAATQSASIPLSFFALYLFHDILQLPMLLAAPISTGLLFIWNYASSYWALVFRRSCKMADMTK